MILKSKGNHHSISLRLDTIGFLATPQSERIIEYVRVEYHVGTEFERALCEESRVTLDVTID